MPTRQFSGLRHWEPTWKVTPARSAFRRHRLGDHAIHFRRLHAELAGKRPVAADIRGLDADVHLRVGLDAVDLAQLLHAVHGEPLDALCRGVTDGVGGLYRVAVADLGCRHRELQQDVQLGDRGDFKAHALLDQGLQHPRIGIGLDRVVRMDARHGRLEAARLGADDGRVEKQEGLGVALLQRIPHVAEVQADFRMRVEELGLLGFGWGRLLEGDRAHGHQRSPGGLLENQQIKRCALRCPCHGNSFFRFDYRRKQKNFREI